MDLHFFLLFFGRLCIGGIFVIAGILNFQRLDPPLAIMNRRGVLYAESLLVIGVFWEIILGALLVIDLWTIPAALGLILFLFPATIIFHNFWDHQGMSRAHHMRVAMTNVMVVGGLLVLVAEEM